MVHAANRKEALEAMGKTLEATVLQGPLCNLDLLAAIVKADGEFV